MVMDITTKPLFWDRHHGTYRNERSNKRRFVRSIPLYWLSVALTGTPSAVRCALLIWYLTGLQRKEKVTISNAHVKEFSLTRQAKNRGLCELEAKGLIEIERRPGCSPKVTVRKHLVVAD